MKKWFFLPAIFALTAPAFTQDWAKQRLENSPRHGEWVTVKSRDRDLKCYIVYPEVKEKRPAILVIHEIFGLTDWVRGVADQLAEAGYVAIAPDFLSGQTFNAVDEARKAISQLPGSQVMEDVGAAGNHARTLPAADGKLGVAGFCWGGGKAFEYAANDPRIQACYVFYGTGPQDAAGVKPVECPVFGFYAENDARVNQTLPKTEELMKAAGKAFDYKIYPGAGHGFMRAAEAPDASEANRSAREEAWKRWKDLLKQLK